MSTAAPRANQVHPPKSPSERWYAQEWELRRFGLQNERREFRPYLPTRGQSRVFRPDLARSANASRRAVSEGEGRKADPRSSRLSMCHICTLAKGGHYFKLNGGPGPRREGVQSTRGIITEFSAKARKRMIDLVSQVDHATAGLPAFGSLTYPDEAGIISGRQVARHLRAFKMAFARRYGKLPAMWRIERKARKSGLFPGVYMPHVHLLTWHVEPSRADLEWLGRTWSRIVSAPGDGQRKHYEVTRHHKSWFIPDSYRGVAAYVSKYCAKVDEAPAEGRCWGIWNKAALPISLDLEEIPQDAFHRMRRVLRRLAKERTGRDVLRPRGAMQGATVYVTEELGRKLVRWAWDVGWEIT